MPCTKPPPSIWNRVVCHSVSKLYKGLFSLSDPIQEVPGNNKTDIIKEKDNDECYRGLVRAVQVHCTGSVLVRSG